MRNLLASIFLLSVAQFASAEIIEVYRWEPYPGRSADMLATMQEAAQIHTALGANIQINALDIGSTQNIDYVMRYDDISDWGAARDRNGASAEWTAFFARYSSDPAGKLVASIQGVNTDPTEMADDFSEEPVFSVNIWEPAAGRAGDTSQWLAAAKAVHEELGARVEIYNEGFGGTNKRHYVMFFDSWTHMAEVSEAMSTSESWQAFMASTTAASASPGGPAAALVERFAGRVVANF